MLLALLEQEDSVAAKILAAQGVTRAEAERRIADTDVAGTGDDFPELAGGRRLELAVVHNRVIVQVDDRDLADLVSRAISSPRQGDETSSLRGDEPATESFAAIWASIRASASDILRRSPHRPQDS
jgi:hypothetical protein